MRNRPITIDFDHYRSLSGSNSRFRPLPVDFEWYQRGREKEEEGEEEKSLEISSPNLLPAGNFFSLRVEKKRLPAWGEGIRRCRFSLFFTYIILNYIILSGMHYAYRSVPGTIPYRAQLDQYADCLLPSVDWGSFRLVTTRNRGRRIGRTWSLSLLSRSQSIAYGRFLRPCDLSPTGDFFARAIRHLHYLSPMGNFFSPGGEKERDDYGSTNLGTDIRQEKTTMELIVDAETDKVLGASMCGPDAPEIMQVGIHPSAAEEFVTMRSITRRVAAGTKLKTNL
ncbi:hypothetical protein BHM03_00055865 [Ensete ventricosum]|nr:hypothetical protein BHM03_00055865 [Ensete ventricosum]